MKVELLGVAPMVWRRFDTYAEVKLTRLHYFIQGAMGWELMHLFSFQDGRGYGSQISSELRLCDVCRVGDALTQTGQIPENEFFEVSASKEATAEFWLKGKQRLLQGQEDIAFFGQKTSSAQA